MILVFDNAVYNALDKNVEKVHKYARDIISHANSVSNQNTTKSKIIVTSIDISLK